MNAHRSLQRTDVLKYSSDKIALMVASEFYRASDRAQYASIAKNCFERARELMGILETIPLDTDVALELSPIYARCTEDQLLTVDSMPLEQIRAKYLELAAAFERASEHLENSNHA